MPCVLKMCHVLQRFTAYLLLKIIFCLKKSLFHIFFLSEYTSLYFYTSDLEEHKYWIFNVIISYDSGVLI